MEADLKELKEEIKKLHAKVQRVQGQPYPSFVHNVDITYL